MDKAAVHLPVLKFGATLRKDAWWAGPAVTFTVFTAFIVYATFRALEGNYFEIGPYLSPFYSPYFPTHGARLIIPITPAMLILPIPAGFRFTCYYYRKAYYRSFGMDPPACAVGEFRKHSYNGETKLFIFQNLHRFVLYLALAVVVVLWYDALRTLWFHGALHVGLGTVIFFANVALISMYTFSCHSLRHLVGGGLNSFSNTPLGGVRHMLWKGVSALNTRHSLWAWLSLFSVALTDVYVRMCATGAISGSWI